MLTTVIFMAADSLAWPFVARAIQGLATGVQTALADSRCDICGDQLGVLAGEDPCGHGSPSGRDLMANDRRDRGAFPLSEEGVEVKADRAFRARGGERVAARAMVHKQLLASSEVLGAAGAGGNYRAGEERTGDRDGAASIADERSHAQGPLRRRRISERKRARSNGSYLSPSGSATA